MSEPSRQPGNDGGASLGARGDADALEPILQSLVRIVRTRAREKWDRDLPLDELFDDRWDRARTLGFGADSSIYGSSYVYGSVEVGRNVWIGPFVLLDGTGGLTIGDNCTISAGVQIYSHDTIARTVSGDRSRDPERAPVQIGERTYIGSQTVIAKGVTIGEGCVVGAGSFVNRDLPAASFAVGTPCRSIGTVNLQADGTVELIRE
jgi:acetyltransferase-like isoleucine patch superfamily enzyme